MTGLAFFAFLANKPSGIGYIDLVKSGTELVDFNPSGFLAFPERTPKQAIIGKGFNRDVAGHDEKFQQ